MMTMETLKRIAPKFGLACLLHEKPFAGVNGSGKHLNWSMGDDQGHNLLAPGRTRTTTCSSSCSARRSSARSTGSRASCARRIASAGNDHRLGANEAPPAIISIFLGDMLTDIFEQIEKGGAKSTKSGGMLDTGVGVLPKLPRDAGDRNRTSPFAFTGNKFEFRAVSSNQSIAYPNIALNVAVTESLDYIATELEKAVAGGKKIGDAAGELLPKIVKENKRIIFNGNNYSKEWEKEAGKRGLLNLKNTVDALPQLVGKESVALFEKYKVLNDREVHSRYEIMVETYNKTVNVEGQLTVLMANRYVLPAALEYLKRVGAERDGGEVGGRQDGRGQETPRQDGEADRRVQEAHRQTGEGARAREQWLGGKAREALPRFGHSGDARAAGNERRARDARSRTKCGRWRPIGRCCSSSRRFALQAPGFRLQA